jgi:hypothetical protein
MASGTRLAGTTAKPVLKARTGPAACTVCGSRLSAYNAGPNCYAHTVDVPWKGPGPRHR